MPASHPSFAHPILTCQESAVLEKLLLDNDLEKIATAMDQVGEQLSKALLADFQELGPMPEVAKILVLAGKGHNAGDAFLATASILSIHSKAEVSIFFPFGQQEMRPLVVRALQKLKAKCTPIILEAIDSNKPYDICLDGILGMSFVPPLRENLKTVLQAVNSHSQISLRAAVDLPSGIADVSGEVVFRADFTYATGVFKSPLLDESKRDTIGRVRYLDIGFFDKPYVGVHFTKASVLLPTVLSSLKKLRPTGTYKNKQGHLVIISGSKPYPGALMMSVKAALQTGVGLLTVCAPESLVPAFSAEVPEAMWIPWPETSSGSLSLQSLAFFREKLAKATAILTGPGLGNELETLNIIHTLIREIPLPIALDANALEKKVINCVSARPQDWGRILLTPHIKEFERMGGCLENLREWSSQHTSITLLKGPLSRICDGRHIYISPYGGPVLARGGSGDILSGIVGGLLAQNPKEPLEALAQALVWHGMSADLLARQEGQVATTTTHLLQYMGEALRTQ